MRYWERALRAPKFTSTGEEAAVKNIVSYQGGMMTMNDNSTSYVTIIFLSLSPCLPCFFNIFDNITINAVTFLYIKVHTLYIQRLKSTAK